MGTAASAGAAYSGGSWEDEEDGLPDDAYSGDSYPQTAYAAQAPAPEAAAAAGSSAAQGEDEVLYLRYIVDHMTELNAEGTGYKGYSLLDFDGDGVRELMINCGAESGYGWRICTCEGGTKVVDLGLLAGGGYYAARPGGGVLVLQRTTDGKIRYDLVRKAGGALVTICRLERTSDAYGTAVWTANEKLITTDSLLALLADFPQETLGSLGISGTQNGGYSAEPYGTQYGDYGQGTGGSQGGEYGTETYADDSWNTVQPQGDDQQTYPYGPGEDDVING